MTQERHKDKEHDTKGMKKATALILEQCWEKGYAAGFDDGYKTGRTAGPFIGEERPHGEWIDEGAMAEGHPHRAFNCSVCDGHIIRVDSDLPNFCEFCGADMREGDGNEV